jgi:concentrative nucleoside transporter, CNT family
MLNVPASRAAFDWAANLVNALQDATGSGMRLVFGYLAGGPAPFDSVRPETSFILAFEALPLILIISVLSKLLYHWRLLQPVVHAVGRALQRVFGITGPVGTPAAANIFVGMVEVPLPNRGQCSSQSAQHLAGGEGRCALARMARSG